MAFFNWEESLRTNVEPLDDEHKNLICIMNQLYAENVSGAQEQSLKRTLMQLTEFTIDHFNHEEAYLESINYTDLTTHKYIHKRLLERLNSYLIEFETGNGRISDQFLQFLKIWLSSHIKGIDGKYKKARTPNLSTV